MTRDNGKFCTAVGAGRGPWEKARHEAADSWIAERISWWRLFQEFRLYKYCCIQSRYMGNCSYNF